MERTDRGQRSLGTSLQKKVRNITTQSDECSPTSFYQFLPVISSKRPMLVEARYVHYIPSLSVVCIKWVPCIGFRSEMSFVSFNSLPHFLHTGTCVKLQAQLMLCLLELCLEQLQAQFFQRSLPPLQKQLVS